MRDVVVIGGGPAGCMAAKLLSKEHDVVVLEEHTTSGQPVQCTGLVTPDVISMSGVKPEILSKIRGAYVHFPNGEVMTVRSKGDLALLIDRQSLDVRMAESALDSGAEIRYGERYLSHLITDDHVTVTSEKGTLESKLLIGADGHSSKVASSLGNNSPKEYVRGIQMDLRHRYEEQDMMILRLSNELAPGFFAWEIPFEDSVRVGLCSSWDRDLPSHYLQKLLKIRGLQDAPVIVKNSGKIPIGGRRTTFGDRVLLTGDAAGLVKPVSGGGLYPTFKTAGFLKETADTALATGKYSARDLSGYEKAWKKEIEKELSRGYMLRRIFTELDDDRINKVYSIIDREDIHTALNDIDLDNPSICASLILKNPSVGLRLLPIILRALI